MFSKIKRNAGSGGDLALSYLAEDVEIAGDIFSDGEIQVDGTMSGNIRCRRFLLGEKARFAGSVMCSEGVVLGEVSGDVRAGSLTLAETARIEGDVLYETLVIEAGARIDGRCSFSEVSGSPEPDSGEGNDEAHSPDSGYRQLNVVAEAGSVNSG